MQDSRKDKIIYDEGWQSFDKVQHQNDLYIESFEDEDSADIQQDCEIPKKSKKHNPVSLITIQLVLALVIAFVVFLLKAIDGSTYKLIREWYNESMRNTLVSDQVFEDIDLSQYSKSTSDQLSATTDEL